MNAPGGIDQDTLLAIIMGVFAVASLLLAWQRIRSGRRFVAALYVLAAATLAYAAFVSATFQIRLM